jgi:hypothetical protein
MRRSIARLLARRRFRLLVHRIHRDLEIFRSVPERRSGKRLPRGQMAIPVSLAPVLGLDRMMAKRFGNVFLAPGRDCFQSRQNPAVQHFPLRAEDRFVGDLANKIVGKDILNRWD